jgi:hypothetical protein
MGRSSKDEAYSEDETVARRDAVIKRMLSTPPRPHSEMKIGKHKTKKKKKEAIASHTPEST